MQATVAIIRAFNTEITQLQARVAEHFDQHPDATIYRGQPGIGDIVGARVLGEFGDDPDRFTDARAARTTPATAPSPAPRARRNRARPLGPQPAPRRAPPDQAFSALTASPGARAYYQQLRARGTGHHAALRQLSNRSDQPAIG